MCGIIGVVSKGAFDSSWAFEKLKRLEYRGYDSYGYYDGQELVKGIGEIPIPRAGRKIKRAILHTRWATHGNVTKENAHPHQSCDGKITIVHNGIIENYEELKKELQGKGHVFVSQTDSEVIAHYFEEELKKKEMKEACRDFIREVKGEFAAIVMIAGDENLYALRRDSPLVLGILENKYILASDIYAFSHETKKAVFFENEEYAVIHENAYEFYREGKKQEKQMQEFSWNAEESEKHEYEHYMIKEIWEEARVAARLLASLEAEQKENFEKFIHVMKHAKKIVFAACGTSYHASLLGVYFLHQCGIEAQTLIGSEFQHFASLDPATVVIFISQSGETMDLIEALKYAQEKGAKVASMVNVPYSTLQRASEISLNICAGQEVSVAATKSFVNQLVLLLRIAKEFGYDAKLDALSDEIRETLDSIDSVKKLAKEIGMKHDAYILGRGLSYPVAREVALKMKEVSYIHAEGMMAGELKHGTIALIDEGTPVLGLVNGKDASMISSLKEVKARGAKVTVISNEMQDKSEWEEQIIIPASDEGSFSILASIIGQLLAYYIALERKLPIDKPRNLAKSVTVK